MSPNQFSLAGRVLDIYDDPGASIVKQSSDEGLVPPLYVLRHQLPTLEDIPDRFFAHIEKSSSGGVIRKFPCDSPANTWLSSLYFLKNGGALNPQLQQKIAGSLTTFHALHGVPQPDLLTKIAAAQETAPTYYQTPSELPTQDMFALTETSSSPKYPIADWDHIKIACEYFETHRQSLPLKQRREFAVKVANRVRDLARETIQGRRPLSDSFSKVASLDFKQGKDPVHRLPQMMELYASQTPCELRLKSAIDERVRTMEKRNQHELGKTFQMLYENRGSYTVDKFAEALIRMDEASGLDDLYGKRLVDPYLSILKIAEDPGSEIVYDEDGIRLSRHDLAKLASMGNELTRHFEPGMVRELVADPEAVFPSLPQPEKQAIAALLL